MESKTSAAALAFARSLRSFQNGSLPYAAFLDEVRAQLTAGAMPAELRDILSRRELIQPLTADAHAALSALLADKAAIVPIAPAAPAAPAIIAPAAPVAQVGSASAARLARSDSAARPASSSSVPPEASTIILGEEGEPADSTATPLFAVGDVLDGRFELVELLGEGGLSRIYRATDAANRSADGTPSAVAVKVMNRTFDEQTESFAAFQQEFEKLRTLEHPNIVRMFDCGREGAAVYVTMEYLVGVSLYLRMRSVEGQPARDPAELQAIIRAIADALEYAHEHQVVHGDLKPGNVIVTESAEIKVIDFGIASWSSRPRTAQERREAAQHKLVSAVTPRYASPQLMARSKPEAADDVYALACVAYELLTGMHPFDDGTGYQTLRFPPPSRPGLAPAQYEAIVKGLEFERRNRTGNVREFMHNFTAAPPANTRRRQALWGAAIAVLIAAVLLVGRYYLPASRAPQEPAKQTFALAPEQPALPPEPAPSAATPNVMRDCATCPQMVEVPAGQFLQGTGNDAHASAYEKPQHMVTIAKPLLLSVSDITVGDFSDFIAATGRQIQGCDIYDGAWHVQAHASWKAPGFAQTAAHPVTCVSWNDAHAYADWLSSKTGHHYRLPSASEWEYAARAGAEATQPWGDQTANACVHANVADQSAARRFPGWDVFACDDGFVNTAPVGSFKPNAFGLTDMLGNVFQWTEDCWHNDYAEAPRDGSARVGGDCGERELRGGSWFSSPSYVRAAYRNHFPLDYRTSSVGFRLVRENAQ